jgi:hypothetical protein
VHPGSEFLSLFVTVSFLKVRARAHARKVVTVVASAAELSAAYTAVPVSSVAATATERQHAIQN